MYTNVTTKLSCSRPILIKSYSTIDSSKVKVKIGRLEAGTTVSAILDILHNYALEIKITYTRVNVTSAMTPPTSGHQVAIVVKKLLNILQDLLRNSQ